MPTVITFHVLIQFAWMEFGVECPYFVFFGRVIELFEVSVSFSTWFLLSIQIILNCIYPCRLFCVHRQELCLVFYEGHDFDADEIGACADFITFNYRSSHLKE